VKRRETEGCNLCAARRVVLQTDPWRHQWPPSFPRIQTPDYKNMSWGIPIGIAAVVLTAAMVIFSSAGPDRTRTVNNNNQPSA
jgi:hypothetical protein